MTDLEQDWTRVCKVWKEVKEKHWNPSLVIFETIYDMRKVDRKIDVPLRHLLDSRKYRSKIRLYGGPTGSCGNRPFRYKGRIYSLIKVRMEGL